MVELRCVLGGDVDALELRDDDCDADADVDNKHTWEGNRMDF
jgi:hypothetical protein